MVNSNSPVPALKPVERLASANKNIDGLVNVYTREGVQGAAKSTGFHITTDKYLTETECRNLYRSDGFGAKIVDRPVGDMTREWFDVLGDTDGIINTFLRTIKAKKQTKLALTWAKVFGGSIMAMGIDDGRNMEEPLDENNIRKIEFLQVYDRYRVTWTTDDLYNDESEPKFGEVEVYTINPIESITGPFKIHESRVLRFDGSITDDRTFKRNNRWNESVYVKVLKQLINLNSSYAGAKDIIDDFVTTTLNIQNLQEMVAAGQDDLVKERLNIIDLGRHTMNTVLLDAEEKFEKSASSIAGLPKLLEEFQQAYAAVSDIPSVVMMGRSPGGLNATGDADIRLYYDQIADAQDDEMYDQLQRLVDLSMKAKEGPTSGIFNDEWAIQFNPLWQPTEKEVVETRKAQSETDVNYIREGVLTNAEVAISRFGGNEYSIETEIDESAERDTPEETGDGEENNDNRPGRLDGYRPAKKLRRKQDTKKRLASRKDRVFDNPDIIEGTTGEENDHTHEFFIFDVESGLGWTMAGGKDNHTHRIEGGTVQPHEDKDGTTHMHDLPKDR